VVTVLGNPVDGKLMDCKLRQLKNINDVSVKPVGHASAHEHQ
jgi:hypothetical protein